MTSPIRVGIIGGSGLYQMPELTDVEEVKVDTPFGPLRCVYRRNTRRRTGCFSAASWTRTSIHAD